MNTNFNCLAIKMTMNVTLDSLNSKFFKNNLRCENNIVAVVVVDIVVICILQLLFVCLFG